MRRDRCRNIIKILVNSSLDKVAGNCCRKKTLKQNSNRRRNNSYGYSVDKYYRLQNVYSWFSDEELSDAEMEETLAKAEQAGSVDFVLSHTCPAKYIPTFMFLDGIDKSQVSHRMEEFYDQLEEILDYGRWWCGHFHTDWSIDKMRFMYYDILELKKTNIREKDRNRKPSTRVALGR